MTLVRLHRRSPTTLTTGALAIAALLLVWRLWPPDPELDRIASRLCASDVTGAGTLTTRTIWGRDREILETVWANPGSPRGRLVDAKLLEPQRNVRRELSTALRAMVLHGGNPLGRSPDRKWAIVWTRLRPRHAAIAAVRLDGSAQTTRREVTTRNIRGFGWTPDSRAFLVLFADRLVRLRVERSGESSVQSVPSLPNGLCMVGVLPDGPMLFSLLAPTNAVTRVVAYRVDLNESPPRLLPISLWLPAPRIVDLVHVSPRGDRLIWSLQSPPTAEWLDGILRRFGNPSWGRHEVWVSRTDGTGMRKIGSVNGNDFSLLGWTPDGKGAAFVRRGFLCTAPVAD